MFVTSIDKLNISCKPASIFDAENIVGKLKEAISLTPNALGLAANQIAIDSQVCIININSEWIPLANPEIIDTDDLCEFYGEQCLSFPGSVVNTARYKEICVKDLFHPAGLIFFGIEAVIVQHEIDHLFGKTMFDRKITIPGRNKCCWCNSGKKYKSCHYGKSISIER